MKQILGLVLALGVALSGRAQTGKGTPVVIELFTSEGCSSCPPADRLLMKFDHEQPIAGADLIVLSEHVDYWNSGGWIDPYSSHEFSERQQRYVSALRVPDPYTPQAVIDGRFEAVGNNARQLEAAIQDALKEKKIPLGLKAVRSEGGVHVELSTSEVMARGAEVYFAIAEDAVQSKVSAGENGGHLLAHTAVVRSLTKGGKLQGDHAIVSADIKMNARWGKKLRVVAFVADRDGGKILGSAMTEL
jgi:hypothetical protein